MSEYAVAAQQRLEQLEAELATTQERLHMLECFIQQVPVAAAIYDTEMRYQAVTGDYTHNLALQGKDVVGQFHEQVMPVPPYWQDVHARAMHGEVIKGEARFEQGDMVGFNRWEVTPWRRADGKIGGIFTFSVVQRNVAMTEIAQERLQTLFRESPLWALYLSPSGQIELFNQDNPAKSLIGHHVFELTPSNMWGRHQAALRDAIQMPGTAITYEIQDLEKRWFVCRLTALRRQANRELVSYKADETGEFDPSHLITDNTDAIAGFILLMNDITERKRAEEDREQVHQRIIDAQREALHHLSTPIIPLIDRLLVLPLVGSIDTARARKIMRALLKGIQTHRARIVLLDITGVPKLDDHIAEHLNKTIQAARLKGAQTIVTGVSDAVAETMIDLNIDWARLDIARDLQAGLILALKRMGLKVVQA